MNTFSKKIILILVTTLLSTTFSYAAKIVIEAPLTTLTNRQPVVVQVLLDAESDKISGISGNFSFPSNLFDIESIGIQSSVVSLWVQQPTISLEKYLDGRTHITFEGIFPGGYDGVRGAYYEGTKPGSLYTVTLIPKNKGTGTIVVDDIIINSFTPDAKQLVSTAQIHEITVPQLTPSPIVIKKEPRHVVSPTLNAFITRDELINRNAWYVVVNERESLSSIDSIFISESEKYNAEQVEDKEWRQVKMPHVLLYQDRTKYVHVKVVYSDQMYTLRTLPPVENSQSISSLSRILVSVLALLFVVYFYGKTALSFFKKYTN